MLAAPGTRLGLIPHPDREPVGADRARRRTARHDRRAQPRPARDRRPRHQRLAPDWATQLAGRQITVDHGRRQRRTKRRQADQRRPSAPRDASGSSTSRPAAPTATTSPTTSCDAAVKPPAASPTSRAKIAQFRLRAGVRPAPARDLKPRASDAGARHPDHRLKRADPDRARRPAAARRLRSHRRPHTKATRTTTSKTRIPTRSSSPPSTPPAKTLALMRELRAGQIPGSDTRLPVLTIGADTDHVAVRHYQAGADIALPPPRRRC